ncbi:MAG: aminopeptidase P family protein [Planctomycetes bacterium]|nr:aminopeptidase P family protein [Planctomycetota bacterium]
MERKHLDGCLVTNRVDQYYLTGFDGEDGAALVLPHRAYLITDGRFAEEAAIHAPWARAVIRTGPLAEAVGKTVRRHRLGRVGLDPAHTSVSMQATLRKACRPSRLASAPRILEQMRIVKDPSEVAAIVRAAEIAQAAFRTVVRRIRIGMTERELATALLLEMLRRGASDASFPIIVAEGPASSLPHARAGDRKIRAGSAVLIDWGATVDHYRSDLTRVVFVRRIPPRFRRMYQNVLAAQAAGIEAVRPGAAFSQVDAQARGVLRRRGMHKAFSHGLGHGLGLDIHEAPRLARSSEGVLEPGMVVTVEPGVYFPGVGGVRIEDDVLVTDNGCRVLTDLPKELDRMVV